jgi:hypothetical protein
VRRSRVVAVAAIAAVALALEAWLLFGRRSGEAAYRPPPSVVVPSLEAAGADAITQTFVPGADGLDAISFVPLPAAGFHTPVDLQLEVEGTEVPLARRRLQPAELTAGAPFWWEVPKVERAAARVFTLRIAAPDAKPGEGIRVAVGPPEYRWGELRAGVRAQWGDLVFETRASQVHVIDTFRALRRDLPWPLRTDGALALALFLLDLATAWVVAYLASPFQLPNTKGQSPRHSQLPTPKEAR